VVGSWRSWGPARCSRKGRRREGRVEVERPVEPGGQLDERRPGRRVVPVAVQHLRNVEHECEREALIRRPDPGVGVWLVSHRDLAFVDHDRDPSLPRQQAGGGHRWTRKRIRLEWPVPRLSASPRSSK
jgi:hypothetical protein